MAEGLILEAALNLRSLLDTGNKREEFEMALDDSNFWRDVRTVVFAVLNSDSGPRSADPGK